MLKKILCVWLPAVSALTIAACSSSCKNPAAKQPTGLNVTAILQPGGGWTNVGANPSGQFEILPGGLPSGGIKIFFNAPWPTSLNVDIDGTVLSKLEDLPAGTNTAVTGYYTIININPNPNPPIWTVGIRPPAVKAVSAMYTVSIKDVSLEPSYTGTDHMSLPATFVAVSQKIFTVGVMITGQGYVTSQPAGVQCPPMCVYDFGQSMQVTLSATPSGQSQLDSWSGACAGSGSNCTLTTNGVALSAGAAFKATAGTLSGCPAMNPPTGYSWFNQPWCSEQNTFNDPSPSLACDSTSYYCCAMTSGQTGGRCGADHTEFPASCDYGNTHVMAQPSGCYIQN